ncbi:ferric-dicitrate binding protein FerR (iron transport regulator) [Streptomyces olivoverticillatus]|uniref:Ferric-dicitrate binding protein FerR (Iron transport regulator) n=1 Tax=Streptomyces olivoverticillatus TaxID=66427 RepID=A0A7W7PIZ8_9ACTN|nr:ferric-dicitrate binding protein FerR (iron transport regulator) [Streptomyces olivoverticillatus]
MSGYKHVVSGYDRKEAEVRRMLDAPRPSVPPELAVRAAERGMRLLRRRRALRRVGWVLLTAAVVAFCVWAAVTEPWAAPPEGTTPPLRHW